ncbi:HAD family hydrolase [bacterium]|nr:HAD family hydrolase [bacterium]
MANSYQQQVMLIRAALIDVDNTLYDWVDFFAPSFRAMVHALAKQVHLSEDALYEQFRTVYHYHGTLEWNFAVQELDVCNGLPHEEVVRLARLARHAFKQSRRKNLNLYPGVYDTLCWLRSNGCILIAATNSPAYLAKTRLKELKVEDLFNWIIGWEGRPLPTDTVTEKVSRLGGQGIMGSRSIAKLVRLPAEDLKPSSRMYELALKIAGVRPTEAIAIGDSIVKDLVPGIELGIHVYWAKYGTRRNERNFDTILRLTHWSADKISSTYDETILDGVNVLERFDILRKLIRLPQMMLPLDGE